MAIEPDDRTIFKTVQVLLQFIMGKRNLTDRVP